MTQRDWTRIGVGTMAGFALAALLGVVLLDVNLRGDVRTDVTLSTFDGTCTLGKATLVRAKKGKQVIWRIANYCADAAKTVTVGNFRRTDGSSGPADCSAPGADYPFTDASLAARTGTVDPAEQDDDGSYDPSDGRIALKMKDRGDLGDEELTYHFDICLDGARSDPMLAVER